MKTRGDVSCLIVTGIWCLWAGALAHGQQSSSHRWPESARQAQLEYEQSLNAVPAPASLRAHHELLGTQPHVAGTDGDWIAISKARQTFEELGGGLQVELHEFYPYLCRPVNAKLEIIPEGAPIEAHGGEGRPTRRGIALPLREDDLLNDPYLTHPGLTYGWNAYSGSGDVTAEVVYANYGTKADFDALRELGIDVSGKIVLCRYGGNYRGYKAKFAEQAGAAAAIIYTDPDDSGYRKGITYPEGGWANDTCIQRGSIKTMDYPGDPLTPGSPATKDAARIDVNEVDLPRIPVQPIGYRAAQQIMQKMTGRALPEALIKTWQGGLPCAYRIEGGSQLKLRLLVQQERFIGHSANVIATLPGAKFPDQKIIIGCHHDAWGYGAGDPLAGTMLVFEAAKSFAMLAKSGRRPDRTIVFALWGAEEFGIIGSTEYCEQNRDELMKTAVAYINLDAATMGPNFNASSAPLLKAIIEEVARDVPQARIPPTAHTPRVPHAAEAKSVHDAWRGERDGPEIGNLGGGSDHIGFYCHVGIPSCHLGAGGAAGTAYHSNYDTLSWYRKVVGEDYEPALMLTRIVNLLAVRLANAPVLPLNVTQYITDTRANLDQLEQLAKQKQFAVDFALIRTEIDRCETVAGEVVITAAQLAQKDDASEAELARINGALMSLERCWLVPAAETALTNGGLPGRPWFKSLYASSDPDSGYAAWVLPALRQAIERGDQREIEWSVSAYAGAFTRILDQLDAVNSVLANEDRVK